MRTFHRHPIIFSLHQIQRGDRDGDLRPSHPGDRTVFVPHERGAVVSAHGGGGNAANSQGKEEETEGDILVLYSKFLF